MNALILFFFVILFQTNIKISSKRYHYDTKQFLRNKKAEQMTRVFTHDEKIDLKKTAHRIGKMPSPKSNEWRHYVRHRLRMMKDGMAVYTTRSYARLGLDKHIEWHCAMDKMTNKLVCGKPCIIFMGAAQMNPNSPIKIKKHVRCPGTRKLLSSLKKRGDCVVIMTDEYFTSQHCGRCIERFPRETKSYRFKKCNDCKPNADVQLPPKIHTNVSKRELQTKRTIRREWHVMRNEMRDPIAATFVPRVQGRRLVSKKKTFEKTWLPDLQLADEQGQPLKLKTVWHRDTVAAKLIMYKGLFRIKF